MSKSNTMSFLGRAWGSWFGPRPVASTRSVTKTCVISDDYSIIARQRHQQKIKLDHDLWRESTNALWDKFVDTKLYWLGDIWVCQEDPLFPRYLALRDAWQRDLARLEEKFINEHKSIPSNWWPHAE